MAAPDDLRAGKGLELDLGRYEVRFDGLGVRLERQPMELLILLVERRNQLITRDDIAARLWGGETFLDSEQGINTAIRKIRQAINDDPEHPRFIQTVVGKGYRFIGPVTCVPVGKREEQAAQGGREAASRFRTRAVVTSVAVLLLMSAAALLLQRRWPRAKPVQVRSLAVLPLLNLSGDPAQEYLADGITEMLITDIGRIADLRVISRTSVMRYQGTRKTTPEIARELHVDAIIEGSLARSGDRVRITTQLIETATDRHLWAGSYERSTADVLDLQDEVARAVARQVAAKVSPEHALPSGPKYRISVEAQDAYLKGLHEADKYTWEGLTSSIEHFERAIQYDPDFAQAWGGLSYSYDLLTLFHYLPADVGTAKAEASARRAIQLDDNLSEAHAALGAVMLHHSGRAGIARGPWTDVERELHRAIALNPSNALAHQVLGYLLTCVLGRFDEGILEMKRALELDPLSANKFNSLGAAFYWSGHYNEALEAFREVSDGGLNTELRHRRMAYMYERNGMEQRAAQELSRAMKLTGRQGLATLVQQTFRSSKYGAAKRAFLLRDIQEREVLARRSGERGQAAWIATDYAQLRDNDQAFEWMDRAFAEGDNMLMFLKVEGQWESLRNDPRFQALAARFGLPR